MCILAGLLLPCVPSKLCWPIFRCGAMFLAHCFCSPMVNLWLAYFLRQILSTARIFGNFSIHSFRIGAATVAAPMVSLTTWSRSWAVGPVMPINSAFTHLLKLSRACPVASRVSPSFLEGMGPRGCCSLLVQSASRLGAGHILPLVPVACVFRLMHGYR